MYPYNPLEFLIFLNLLYQLIHLNYNQKDLIYLIQEIHMLREEELFYYILLHHHALKNQLFHNLNLLI